MNYNDVDSLVVASWHWPVNLVAEHSCDKLRLRKKAFI